MDRTKEAVQRAQFHSKGKWYLAEEVDTFLEELSVRLEEDGREKDELEKETRKLRETNAALEQELSAARETLERRREQSEEERQRRVCRELEQERDGLIEDIKALRRFRDNFQQAISQDAERLIQQMGELVSQKLL